METEQSVSVVEPTKPKFRMGWPEWWHPHGMKMQLGNPHAAGIRKGVVINNSVAQISIQETSALPNPWKVTWVIQQSKIDIVTGAIFLGTFELEAAFCLRERIDLNAELLIHLYGGSSAVQGKFIRWERWLNIPMPGTGMDGDPNISVEVTREIKEAVAKLIFNG